MKLLVLTITALFMTTIVALALILQVSWFASLCTLIFHTLIYIVTQGRSAVMGVKIIYKKAIKMIITVVKIG